MLTNLLKCLSATALLIGLAASAHADPLASWETAGCSQNAPCYQASGINGSSLTGNVPYAYEALGYTGGNDAWAAGSGFGNTYPNTAVFGLTMTTATAVQVGTFNFSVFNNDCENGGVGVVGCSGVTWNVSEAVNGGTYTSIGSVISGPAYLDPSFSLAAGVSLNAGDTLDIQVSSLGGQVVATGQYFFSNISLNTPVPEPASMALLGLGVAGVGFIKRRKV